MLLSVIGLVSPHSPPCVEIIVAAQPRIPDLLSHLTTAWPVKRLVLNVRQ